MLYAFLSSGIACAQFQFPALDGRSTLGGEHEFPDGPEVGTTTEIRDKRIVVGDGETFEPWSNPDYYEKAVGNIVPYRDSRVGGSVVPEPSTWGLLGVGSLAFLILLRHRKHRRDGI